ncbi:hypothetical protein B0A48_12023 [Cryoendolithus antarcticus]|uniref:C2H2-type domain-containing protein n=1 Tax=Cryoendolithus antarcticus TaxID=1507870 RepID=A0A1V8STN0_9PEZI|nr:hypothetical protein B0A48_12023 [Cryoendolithus antarcticus]
MVLAGDFDEVMERWRNRTYPQPSSFDEEGSQIGSNFVPNNVSAFGLGGNSYGYAAPQELQHARVSSDEAFFPSSNNINPLLTHDTNHQIPNPQAHIAVPDASIPPLRGAYTDDITSYNFFGAQLGDHAIEAPFRGTGLPPAERKSRSQYTAQVTEREAHVPQLQGGHVLGTGYQPPIDPYPQYSFATDGKPLENIRTQLAPVRAKQLKRKKGVDLRKESLSSARTQSGLFGETPGAVPYAQPSTTPRLQAPPLPPFYLDVLPEQATETDITYLEQNLGLQPGQIAHECDELDCGEVFGTAADLRQHAKTHLFYCPLQERDPKSCDALCFPDKRAVDRHLLSHFDPQYHCRRGCGSFFHRFDGRFRHEKKCDSQPSKRSKTQSDASALAGSAGPPDTASSSIPQAVIASAHAMQRSISTYPPVGYSQQLPMTPAAHLAPADRLYANHAGSWQSSLGTTPASIVSNSSRGFSNSMPYPSSTQYTGQTPGSFAPSTDLSSFSTTGSMQDYSQTPSLRKQ